MRKEWNIFRTAIMFFTRIPVGKIDFSSKALNSSGKYLPVIGWIVGGISAIIFLATHQILPVELAVILSMASSIMITGAFHEDGFADVCDGLGGGWTREKILEIMKDSRVGAFGVIGMIMLLFAKFISLSEMHVNLLPASIIAGHTISRFSAVLFIYSHQYVRDDQGSKSKPVGKKINQSELIFASLMALFPFILFPNAGFLLIIPVILLIKYRFARYAQKKIGGYTGDCLGALQQITETSFYIFVLIYMEIHSFIV